MAAEVEEIMPDICSDLKQCLAESKAPVSREEALQGYSRRFGADDMQAESYGFDHQAFPWHHSVGSDVSQEVSGEQVKAELEKDLGLQEGALDTNCRWEKPLTSAMINADIKKAAPLATMSPFYNFIRSAVVREEDSDGEELSLCQQCKLPLGNIVYSCMHGECMAQVMVQDMRNDEKKRLVGERQTKEKTREEYGIGWKAEDIPRNKVAAGKLAMREVQEGMVCLVLDESAGSVRIASTTEPAAAVNLEYLSLALEVRRREGHEPVFSLDPVNPSAETKKQMQKKVFVPQWLAGTSAGEVLFQADYHLKELSMGEYEQPVVGMMSGFDYSDLERSTSDGVAWHAREWFVVKKAEIQICDSDVLIPYVKMAVEAREQVLKAGSLKDKPITRPNHPMVKYAESFSRNFDLIAERKSVIYHLRELAKASIFAKHLMDSNVVLDPAWFSLAEKSRTSSSMEVPQLWHERLQAKVDLVEDGAMMSSTGSSRGTIQGVYGGVKFGLEKFNLSSARAAGRPGAVAMLSTSRLGAAAGLSASLGAGASLSASRLGAGAVLSAPVGRVASMASAASFAAAAPSRGMAVRSPTGILTSLYPASPPPPAGSFNFNIAKVARGVPGLSAKGLSTSRVPPTGMRALSAEAPSLEPTSEGFASAISAPRGLSFGARQPAARSAPLGFGRTDGVAPSTGIEPVASLRASTAGQFAGAVQRKPSPGAAEGPQVSVAAPLGAAFPGAAPMMMPPGGVMPGMPGMPGMPAPAKGRLQGVDLRLDNFDLTKAKRVSLEAQSGSWGDFVKPLDECLSLGDSFWSALEDEAGPFKQSDRALLRSLFNPCLSDRRTDGDRFTPPDASYSHVAKLRALIKEEEDVRQRRVAAFCSKDFLISEPGALFPSSWTSKLETACGKTPTRAAEGRLTTSLVELPEYRTNAKYMLQDILKTAVPTFDKSTEEGTRFRVYQMGSLEVRTTQDLGCDEIVGVIFSIRDTPVSASQVSNLDRLQPQEKIMKATEYVERVRHAGNVAGQRRYYVVLETATGHRILTERLDDGSVVWEEDSQGLDDRNSLAKALRRCKECEAGAAIHDLQELVSAAGDNSQASRPASKVWARSVFNRAAGAAAETGAKTKKEDPAIVEKRKEEQALKLAQNQALAEQNTAFIPMRRVPPAQPKGLPLPSHVRA